ncbi:MAG: hypothetical protein NT150_00420 [Bacteroidetes bacterium]|nr:hypothetical protein [Bacteroidota bacterium]
MKNTEDGKKSAIEKILISPQKLDSVDLPKALLYKGEFVDGFKWKDSEGEKLVFITETGEYPTPTNKEYSTDAELYAYCYLKHGNDYVLSWKVQDFYHECPPIDLTVKFISGALQVTDINENGLAEIWLMYKLACRGDVSPAVMKIVMYEGKQKYAVRGRNRVRYNQNEFLGGENKFDTMFEKHRDFKVFADSLWMKNIEDNFN